MSVALEMSSPPPLVIAAGPSSGCGAEGFSKTELLELAREVDSGFDVRVFIDMLRHLARYGDVDLALGDVDVDIAALRAFFQQWMTELEAR